MGTPAPKRGRKRKSVATTPIKNTSGSARKSRKIFEILTIEQYRPKDVGTRVLSCGEGEQIGHPGRTVTRKPRAVDTFPEDLSFVQVAAGGVHSLVLTTEGIVYSCGINEKGTVPVVGLEAEGSTDEFTEIEFAPDIKQLGKIVQITAGASFSAALTEKGSVIAWGNLRDTQGEVNVHETLTDIQKKPVVVIRHKSKENWHIVKIAAGENHLAMLSNEGELLTFGEGSMGQLGRSVRTQHIRSKFMVDQSGTSLILKVLDKSTRHFVRFVNVWAGGFWTCGRAEDGRLFVCGLNNYGQLGKLEAGEVEEANMIPLIAYAEAFPADKVWTHISGVQHIVLRNEDGKLYGIGKNTDNTLGLGTWEGNQDDTHWRYDTLQRIPLPEGTRAAGVDATLGASIFWTDEGKAYAFGCDTVGQLGLGIKDSDEKVVPVPRLIGSAHLDGFRVINVSIADTHALFLAAPVPNNIAKNNDDNEAMETKEAANAEVP